MFPCKGDYNTSSPERRKPGWSWEYELWSPFYKELSIGSLTILFLVRIPSLWNFFLRQRESRKDAWKSSSATEQSKVCKRIRIRGKVRVFKLYNTDPNTCLPCHGDVLPKGFSLQGTHQPGISNIREISAHKGLWVQLHGAGQMKCLFSLSKLTKVDEATRCHSYPGVNHNLFLSVLY